MDGELTRRTFVRNSVLASAGAAMALGADAGQQVAKGAEAPAKGGTAPAQGAMPMGKIGDMEISRIILGGNLLSLYHHSRDQRYVHRLVKEYNTEAKLQETLALCESLGINTMSGHSHPNIMNNIKKHREKNAGKMKWIICPTADIRKPAEYDKGLQELIDAGTDSIYVWGVHSDQMIKENKVELIGKACEMIKSHGVSCGVGAHDLRVVQECEKNKFPVDYYIKTFHHHNYPTGPRPDEIKGPYNEYPGYWCSNPQETIEFMKTVEKPWIAFKVMAAGTIPPKDAFRYVIENGADFVLAGMFDFDVEPDVRIIKEILASNPKRVRPWRA
ncbi:MAG: hypothetical protein JXQ73_11520 [Phycisphaerae bacterium]|nr:hypothetical protein [Phycisphaerae bacterium]